MWGVGVRPSIVYNLNRAGLASRPNVKGTKGKDGYLLVLLGRAERKEY